LFQLDSAEVERSKTMQTLRVVAVDRALELVKDCGFFRESNLRRFNEQRSAIFKAVDAGCDQWLS
jgi:hypothetical protein